jgi:hypothetical protein
VRCGEEVDCFLDQSFACIQLSWVVRQAAAVGAQSNAGAEVRAAEELLWGCMYVCMYGWMDGWMCGWLYLRYVRMNVSEDAYARQSHSNSRAL